jgi:hypothetical protein
MSKSQVVFRVLFLATFGAAGECCDLTFNIYNKSKPHAEPAGIRN